MRISILLAVLVHCAWGQWDIWAKAAPWPKPPRPKLLVLDLDDCVWFPEMYTLSRVPTAADVVIGELANNRGQGVVGVKSGNEVISLYPGALTALQEVMDGMHGKMRLGVASSAYTAQAVAIGKAAMQMLEVLPGKSVYEVLMRGWKHPKGEDDHNIQIGRSFPLSSDKSKTHFPILRDSLDIPYNQMLFFDDCNWSDHCKLVEKNCPGVVTQRTPNGITEELWRGGLEKFSQVSKRREAEANSTGTAAAAAPAEGEACERRRALAERDGEEGQASPHRNQHHNHTTLTHAEPRRLLGLAARRLEGSSQELWEAAYKEWIKANGAKLTVSAWRGFEAMGRGAITFRQPGKLPSGKMEYEEPHSYIKEDVYRSMWQSGGGSEGELADLGSILNRIELYDPQKQFVAVFEAHGIMGADIVTPNIPPKEMAKKFAEADAAANAKPVQETEDGEPLQFHLDQAGQTLALDGGDFTAWHEEWRQRLGCWWMGLPLPTQSQLGGCLGAISLHLASRYDAALRAINGPSANPMAIAGAAEPGCEWINGASSAAGLRMPSLPDFPAFDFALPPLPGRWLAPDLQQLQSRGRSEQPLLATERLRHGPSASSSSSEQRWGQVTAGAGAGAASALVLAAIGMRLSNARGRLSLKPKQAAGNRLASTAALQCTH